MEDKWEDTFAELYNEQQRLQLALSKLVKELAKIERRDKAADNYSGIQLIESIKDQYEGLVDRIICNEAFKDRILKAKLKEVKGYIEYGS